MKIWFIITGWRVLQDVTMLIGLFVVHYAT